MLRNRLFAVAVALPALLLAAGGCSQPSSAEPTAGSPPSPDGSVQRVTAATPTYKTLSLQTTQPGRVEAFETAPLYPKIEGYVDRVLVDIGDAVSQGQELIEIAVPELHDDLAQREALVAQARAEVKQAQSAMQAARAAVKTANARISQATAGVARAEAEHDRWSAEHERIKELSDSGSVTPKLLDETLHQFKSAAAARDEATAGVESASAGREEAEAAVLKAEADVAAAKANLQVAQADVKRATTMVAYTKIKSPFDGVVTQRNVDTGHYVQPPNGGAAVPLVVVARTDKVRIFVDVPEIEAPWVDGGEEADRITVRIQSLQGQLFEGQVTRTSWALSASNRSLRTEIDIDNAEGRLRPGMYATATILLEEKSNVPVLPITAVLREGDQAFCNCVVEDQIERKPIQLGLRAGGEVEVIEGLNADDVVVMVRGDTLQPGQAVGVIEPQE